MRILLLNQNHIGDALFTTPAIAALRDALPDAYIVNAVVSSVEPLFAANPHHSELWNRPVAHWWDYVTFLFRVRKGHFDIVIPLSASSTLFGVYALCSGAKKRIGLEHRAMKRFATDLVRLHDSGRHHVLDHLDQMEVITPIRRDFPIEFHLLPEWRGEARNVFSSLGLTGDAPLIGLNPGASVERKMWPVERWAELADRLTASGGRSVLFGGPDDAALTESISRCCRTALPSTQGRLELGPLAAAIAGCRVFVSGDTGPLHVAAAVGTPVVALHGPTDPTRTGPFTDNAVVIHHPEDREDGTFGTMETISVEEVAEAVEECERKWPVAERGAA